MDLERTFHNIIYVMMTSLLFRIARGRPLEFNGDHVTFRPINFANDNDVINFRNVVDSLEQLGILAPGNCYALDFAERTVEKGDRSKTGEGVAASIIVSLRLRLSADLPTNERADISVTTPTNAADSSAIVACSRTMTPPTTDVMTSPTDVSQSETSSAADRKRPQLLSINMRQASINSSRSMTSPPLNVSLEVEQMETSRNSTRKGVAVTQVIVMGLCSSIIGIFFVAVATLRIRNYCRRLLGKNKEEGHYRRPGQRKKSVVTKPSSVRGGYSVTRHLPR